jgi:glycosyltransferase involved in cell wall biosynthesis
MRFNEWINLKLFQPVSAQVEGRNQYSTTTQQMIRLSVITQFYPPDYAATGQLIEELVKNLGFLGVDVDVFTSQPGYAFKTAHAPAVEQVGRVRIQRSRTAQLWSGRIRGKAVNGILYTFRAALHLFRVRNRNNILLVTTAPPFLPLLGYLARLLFGIPYICVLYDLYPDIAIALGVLPKRHWLAQLWQNLNRRIWRSANGIIVLSPAMKRQVLMNCPGIGDKISVIHSWSDPDWIVPIAKKENWFAWKYNLVTKFTVLYSGNLGRCHDMDTILAAAKELRGEGIQFVCIGSGAKREQLMQEVKDLGLDNFLFLPYQEKHILPYSLTACDLSLVTVDDRTENLVTPSKLYSALASGRPIAAICCQDSYLRELIREADCGGAFENGDSSSLAQFIRLLSRDHQLAQRLGQSGRHYLRSHFTPNIISKQYLDALRRAMSLENAQSISNSRGD